MVKKILLFSFLFLLISVSASFAAEPYVISFQGKIDPIPATPFDVDFVLYKDAGATIAANWQETHAIQSTEIDANGIINRFLGNDQDLEQVILDNTAGLWLKITVDGTPLDPAQALTATPFAFVAKRVKNDASGVIVDAKSSDEIAISGITQSNEWGKPAVYAEAGAVAIQAKSSAYGVMAEVDGAGGNYNAIQGTNTGAGNGVYGKSSATGKAGIKGKNLIAGGYGVYGLSVNGHGVYGESTDGYGVYGLSVNGHGVYGESTDGYGVYGLSVSGHGVIGSSESSNRSGVYGTGLGWGVLGISTNSTVTLPWFGVPIGAVAGAGDGLVGISGFSQKNYGVFGLADTNPGICGRANSSVGVAGVGADLPEGWDDGDVANSNAGVRGLSRNDRGVEGISDNDYGVKGHSKNNHGVVGSTYGTDKAGIYGSAVNGPGIYGYSNKSTTAGIYAHNTNNGPALEIGNGKIKMSSNSRTITTNGQTVSINRSLGSFSLQDISGGVQYFNVNYDKLDSSSKILLTLERFAGSGYPSYGSNTFVMVGNRNTNNKSFTIYFSRTIGMAEAYALHYLIIN
ncbi:MAG: hypothetical protein U9R38_06810 [Candidatus Margulisiibacteriota bacterium]|nr:hypothetical protein [Candidatus Margulisiibacteriota bacterium]